MKRTIKLIYIIAIFCILSIPVGYMKFYKAENTENRQLATLSDISYYDFGTKFENYIADNFAFRDKLVNAQSQIKDKIFGIS